MDLEQFSLKVIEGVRNVLGEDKIVSSSRVQKNNGVLLEGIVIHQEGRNVSPTIYINELYDKYQEGQTFSSIIGEIVGMYDDYKVDEEVDMDFFMHYDRVKTLLAVKLINLERNEGLLCELPHRLVENLAAVVYCSLPEAQFSNAVILIHNSHLDLWDVTEEQLLTDAWTNTPRLFPAVFQSMEEIMRDMLSGQIKDKLREAAGEVTGEDGLEMDDELLHSLTDQMLEAAGAKNGEGLTVLTNVSKLFGAACLLYPGLLAGYSAQTEHNFYILPSSVHEVLLLPDTGREKAQQLKNMVCEVNATQVEPEEFLADSVYYYDRGTDQLKLIV